MMITTCHECDASLEALYRRVPHDVKHSKLLFHMLL